MDEQDNNKETAKYLRTLLRSDVYDRLMAYAKTLSTGMDKWDIGVAIERLLDFAVINERINEIEFRIMELENSKFVSDTQPKPVEVKKKDDDDEQLLGSHHIKAEEIKCV